MVITVYVCLFLYLTVILVSNILGKQIRQKIFPKNSKRMKTVQNFGNLAVWELPYHLKYQSFGSLMPGLNTNINSCLEPSGGQSSNAYLNVIHFFQHQSWLEICGSLPQLLSFIGV